MRVIIVGCGRVGSALAHQLDRSGHQVTVIDQDGSAFDNLAADFHGRTIKGDVLTRNVLHRAEIESAEALAAVTSSDSLNALVAHVVRTEYRVSRVVARNFDPRQWPLQEAFGIPIVSTAGWGAHRIEELLSEIPLRMVLWDRTAKFAVFRLEVPADWGGRALADLLPEDRGKALAWTRAGQPLPISGEQSLVTGDLVYLSVAPDEIEALRRRLGFPKEHSA